MKKNDEYISVLYDLDRMMQIEGKPIMDFFGYDEAGNQTGDPEKVVTRSEPIEIRNYRLAQSENDFQIIFDQEYNRHEATDPEKFKDFHIGSIENKLSFLNEYEQTKVDYPKFELFKYYLDFLKGNTNTKTAKTFKTEFSEPQLKSIRKKLIDLKFIRDISENDFLYLFSEKPITPRMKRIQWNSSKVKAKRFLEILIGEKFSNPTGNKCFVSMQKPKTDMFDSNTVLTTGYPDIDNIFKQLG